MSVVGHTACKANLVFRHLSAFCIACHFKLVLHYVCRLSLKGNIVNNLLLPNRMASSITQLSNLLGPPASVCGMKILDRDAFHKEVEVPYVVTSSEKIKTAIKILKPFFLKLRKFEPVQEDDGKKIVFLNPILVEDKITKIEQSLEDKNIGSILFKTINLTYENWEYADIFKAVFPPDIHEGVSGFSIIGHILHLNLKPHTYEYKDLIGQILLDKKPNIKTVVNKALTIDNKFRNFKMEVLAGEPKFNVTVKENGVLYELDFSEVFWNPRLGTEHSRIVKKLNSGDVVFDVFAGVGPFAIPAAKKKCYVYANDLNMHSFKWLCHNAKLNKVDSFVKTYNLDGRDFITNVMKDKLKELWLEKRKYPRVHVIMNLPALSFDFLNAFQNLLPSCEDGINIKVNLPIVHCYFFNKTDNSEERSPADIGNIFGVEMRQHCLETVSVRNVAPAKIMMCTSFTLPEKVLFCSSDETNIDEPQPKKIKICS